MLRPHRRGFFLAPLVISSYGSSASEVGHYSGGASGSERPPESQLADHRFRPFPNGPAPRSFVPAPPRAGLLFSAHLRTVNQTLPRSGHSSPARLRTGEVLTCRLAPPHALSAATTLVGPWHDNDRNILTVVARILVIDDNEPFRASVRDLLETLGYAVSTASDGEDGVRQFEQAPFDLVVCDLFMPKKDGLETIGDILRKSPGTPIISTTGHEASVTVSGETLKSNYLHAAREFGATHTLVKPFDPDEFLDLVRLCLGGPAPKLA